MQSRTSSISIALCTYNGEQFLRAQLSSFLAQSYMPGELVVCDDRSTDRTRDVLEEFASEAPFPVHLHVNNRNLGSTRNFDQAISLCNKDLIALSDQDDVWLESKLDALVSALESEPEAAGAFSDADVVDNTLKPLGYTLWDVSGFGPKRRDLFASGHACSVLAGRNVVTGATLMFRSELRDRILPIPPGSVHDAWIAWIICGLSRLVAIKRPLILYRQHQANQIGAVRTPLLGKIAAGPPDSRARYYQSLAVESRRALDRLAEAGAVDSRLESMLVSRARHYERRASLRRPRHRRILPVAMELLAGRYNRFSGGFTSATRDILAVGPGG